MVDQETERGLCVLSENRVDMEDLHIPDPLRGWSASCLAMAESDPSRLSADVLLLAMPPQTAGLRAWLARFRVFNPSAQILLAEYEESVDWYRSAIELGVDGLLALPLGSEGWRETLTGCAEALAAGEAQRRVMGHLERSSHSLEESRRQLADMLLSSYENLGRVHAQLEERLGQLSILYRLGRDLGRESNWDQALERFLGSCVDTLEFGGVALLLWSYDGRRLAVRAELSLAGEALAKALRQLKALPADAQKDEAILGLCRGELVMGEALRADIDSVDLLAMPLTQGEEAEGFLVFHKAYGNSAAFDGDFHFLKTVQTLLGEAVAGAKAVDRLKRLGEFNRSVLESVHAAVLTVDGRGEVSYRNPRAADLFGDRLAVGTAFTFDEGFQPLDGGARELEERDWIQRECALSAMEPGEERRRLLLSTTCLPMRHESDTRHVMVGEDLTEYKQLEAELRHAERLSSLGQLSAGMAHEIRNPLAGIAMTAQVLQSRLDDRPETEPYLQRIQAEVQRLERIVRSLLDYSRPARPQLASMDLRQAAGQAIGDLKGLAATTGIELLLPEGDTPCPARADRDQIHQVLLNLIQNAIQACAEGDRVGLRLERAAAAGGGAGLARLIVWDSGPGVSEAAVVKLFDPFYTTKAEGTGLGLSLCQQIVKEHGGQLSYRPREEGGSEFIIELAADMDPTCHEESRR
jgi:signal transduction histidine kinase